MTKIFSCAVIAIATLIAAPAHAAPRVAGCVNPQDFMANPNDETVDAAPAIRSAITAALAGSHVVCIPGRIYKLLSTVGTTNIFDLTGATDLSIIGEGPATVLQLGNLSATSIQVFNLASGAARVRFQDLVVDGTLQATGTTASSLFKLGGGASAVSDIALEAVQVVGARGNGVAIDSSGTSTTGVEIRACRFAANHGAAIQVQGATRVLITANYFANDLGLEIEAPVTHGITGLTISNNVMTRLPPFPGAPVPPGLPALAIQLSAPTATPNTQLAIVDNLVLGGRISVQRYNQVTIAGNSVVGDVQATSDPELLVTGGTGAIQVTCNVFERTSCTAGHVVLLGGPSDALQNVGFTGNAVAQTNASCLAAGISSPLQVAGTTNVVVSANHVSLAVSAPSVTGLLVGPSPPGASYLAITGNTIEGAASGTLGAGIELGTSVGAPPVALVTDNVTARATVGVKVDTTTAPSIPLILNNVFADATTPIGTTSSNPAVAIRSNLRGPSHFSGAGSPQGVITAPIGSLYLQTNATANGFWVKQTGTGNTGWVAKN